MRYTIKINLLILYLNLKFNGNMLKVLVQLLLIWCLHINFFGKNDLNYLC
jgi:hypothetical protein